MVRLFLVSARSNWLFDSHGDYREELIFVYKEIVVISVLTFTNTTASEHLPAGNSVFFWTTAFRIKSRNGYAGAVSRRSSLVLMRKRAGRNRARVWGPVGDGKVQELLGGEGLSRLLQYCWLFVDRQKQGGVGQGIKGWNLMKWLLHLFLEMRSCFVPIVSLSQY